MAKSRVQKHTLNRRDADVGVAIPFRRQCHGDEFVAAGDIPLSAILLTADELGQLLQEPYAHRALFKKRKGESIDVPMFRGFQPIRLKDKIESAHVTLYVAGEEISLGASKLKGITLQPKDGGMTEMACTVQCTPTLDASVGTLLDHMDDGVQVKIVYEHNPEQAEIVASEPAEEPKQDDAFEKAAKAQVEAFKGGRKAKNGANARV